MVSFTLHSHENITNNLTDFLIKLHEIISKHIGENSWININIGKRRLTTEELRLCSWINNNHDKCGTKLVYINGSVGTARTHLMNKPYVEYGGIFGDGQFTIRKLTDLTDDERDAIVDDVENLAESFKS